MTPEQKALLEHKRELLRARWQAQIGRENVQALSFKLPPDVAIFLQAADRPTERSDFNLSISIPWYMRGYGGDKSEPLPADYYSKKFGWPQKLIAALRQLPQVHASKPAYLWLDGPLFYPLFIVPLGWLHVHLPLLAQSIDTDFRVMTTDGAQGIHSLSYLGYVEDDWSPEETTYELRIYGHGVVCL